MRNSGRVLLRLLLQHDGRKTSNRLACLLPGGASWSLQWSEGWGGSLVLAGGVAWVVCQPPVMLCAGGHAQDPPFASGTTEGAVGFWPFCIFCIICPNWPCTHLFLIRYSVFVFCCLRRRLSRCKHCSKGSQVPACLRFTNSYLLRICFEAASGSCPYGVCHPPREAVFDVDHSLFNHC